MSQQSPSPALVAAAKGLAISTSFIATGSLFNLSAATLPGIIHSTIDDKSSAQTAAQQFALAFRNGKTTLLPAELLSTLSFAFLAYHFRRDPFAPNKWTLYASAAVSIFGTVPYTLAFMQEATQKLVQLAEAPRHEADTKPELEHKKGGLLGVPGQSGEKRPPITPIEEFEPYEDSPFSTDEYERFKVQKMLKQWEGRNLGRAVLPLAAGVLGLWAMLQ